MTDQRTREEQRSNRERVTGPFRPGSPATNPENERLWDQASIPITEQRLPLWRPDAER